MARTKGSHTFLKHPDGRATVVPAHPGETIGPGLLRAILRDVEMLVDDLIEWRWGSQASDKKDIARITAMRDDIDFSDIPLKLDWSNADVGKFYRPPKKTVTMRLDADVLEWLQASAKDIRPGPICCYDMQWRACKASALRKSEQSVKKPA